MGYLLRVIKAAQPWLTAIQKLLNKPVASVISQVCLEKYASKKGSPLSAPQLYACAPTSRNCKGQFEEVCSVIPKIQQIINVCVCADLPVPVWHLIYKDVNTSHEICNGMCVCKTLRAVLPELLAVASLERPESLVCLPGVAQAGEFQYSLHG